MRGEKGGRVRITGGELRGRVIDTPGGDTHPMGERERLAIFNMLGKAIEGAKVLDAYAGSGALGIEALSRGADEVVFVDESHVAMRTANMNCMMLGFPEDEVAFYRGSVSAFYKKFVQGKGVAVDPRMAMILETFPKQVDIILADPPYDNFNSKEVSRLANGYLKDGGILVLSHPGEELELPNLTLETSRKYAGARISVYHKD